MVAPSLVLIDTCVWVPFFNRKPSLEKTATTELLKTDRAALIGPVLTEILHGFRRDEEADWAASSLFGIHYIELNWEHWKSAARIGRKLARNGHRLPLTDLALAAVSMQARCLLYSTDPHFDLMSDLTRFSPSGKQ